MKAPMELKTKRLLLRPLSDEALAARLAEENDPGMRAALEEMLAGNRAQPGQRLWHTLWEMAQQQGGAAVGSFCFHGAPMNGAVEIGYGVEAEFRGRGYAQEAVRAAANWAFGQQDVYWLEAEAAPDNAPSLHLLEKLGFVRCGEGEEGPRFSLEKPAPANSALFMCLFTGLGISFGVSFHHLGLGLSLGAAAGLVLGTALDAADRQRRAELKALREGRST